jgi:uncharacterized protein YuzE
METIDILKSSENVTWEYDQEGDVLYISLDDPKPATTIDLGDGVFLRIDEGSHQVVGVTLFGIRQGLLEQLKSVEN